MILFLQDHRPSPLPPTYMPLGRRPRHLAHLPHPKERSPPEGSQKGTVTKQVPLQANGRAWETSRPVEEEEALGQETC